MLIYYEDGRFMKDPIFGFFALNYIIRHRNSSGGKWFVDKFNKDNVQSLEEIRHRISEGDTSFVNSLTYFNQRIKGSAPYWFKKRCELYSWINHHVEQGNGAPMFFITLSCAEHYWPDIFRLIKERMHMAGEDSSQCFYGSKQTSTILNEYSLVVQEYFEKRVEAWLEVVGKPIFGIKHYWVRLEFAPGRGQIHAHLLAISDHLEVYEKCHADMKDPVNGEAKRTQRLSKWAFEKYGLTASVMDGFDKLSVDRENTPCKHRYSEVELENLEADTELLMKAVQTHDCNGFCLMADSKGESR